jgi:hypothetical protein
VDVVGVVLGVVEFDEHGRAVDALVVGLARVRGAGPGEVQPLDPGVAEDRRRYRRSFLGGTRWQGGGAQAYSGERRAEQ